jgi:hypothetical protein
MPLIRIDPIPQPLIPGSLHPSLVMSTLTRTRKSGRKHVSQTNYHHKHLSVYMHKQIRIADLSKVL